MSADERVVLGVVGAAHGVQGWVKVSPFTERRETLLGHACWQLGRAGEWRCYRLLDGRAQGSQLVVQLEGVTTRDQARALTGAEVAVAREALPALEPGEFYWADLVGLEVVTRDGVALGKVERLMETGANDVLVVAGERERLIPFLIGRVVLEVDVERGRMEVDWDPDY